MTRVFGIETEYGITVDNAPNVDVVAESIALVRSYTEHGALMKWDYRNEDPHRDARGFRAKELLQDTDESAYFEVDRNRPLTFEEIKSDLVLSNGARFYNDHAHPEYSTPECTTLREIVAHDKAGERIVAECARRRNAHLPENQRVRLYKNNTDFAGHSYGCHDNYLMRRDSPWGQIVAGMMPFLVTRQIFAGAGKLGVEAEGAASHSGVYQLSQRADFFSVLVSIDTMNKRPLVNTRDEPHADPKKFRRFHVIIGDANMSEWATAMKIGTTALVAELIERGEAPHIELAQPIEALKAISRDPSRRWIVELSDGRKISAIDLQRLYLDAASKLDGTDEDYAWLLREWENVLDELASEPDRTRDRVDWVAKKFLLDALRDEEQLDRSDPWLQAVDLQYHDVDLERGLHYDLVRLGSMRRFVTDDEISAAIFSPPETTRAFVRGRAVARFQQHIAAVQWDELVFRKEKRLTRMAMQDPFLDRNSRSYTALRDTKSYDDFLQLISTSSS
jgi:proteasome accessory factor PafA2